MKNLRLILDLTIAELKIFIRDKSALFWSLMMPVLIISIFGVLDFNNFGTKTIGLVYNDDTKIYAESLKEILKDSDTYKFENGTIDETLNDLENEDITAILEFKKSEDEIGKVEVISYISKENEQVGSLITMVTEKVLSEVAMGMQQIDLPLSFEQEVVNTNNLRAVDYLVPGIIAMSIMQSNLFAVIGAIVGNREKGILKRLFATPLPKGIYLIANIITRMIISMLQIILLIIFSYAVFKIKIVGSLALLGFVTALGSLVFISIGFMISGFTKTTESARAIVMPVQMLMMFTSGVYFDRALLPDWLFNATKPIPLTYLSDVTKDIMIKGENLSSSTVRTAIIALTIWLVVTIVACVMTFKWEKE